MSPLWLLALAPAAAHPRDEELLALVDAEKLVSARTLAEEVLAEDPRSVVGHYALARALWQSEAALPRARAHYIEAVDLYEDHQPAEGDETWRVHARCLADLAWLAGEMAAHREQLDWLDAYNRGYDPDLTAEKAWPLMMLGELEEARALALEAALSDDAWQQSAGLNTLCALASEAGDRAESYRACMKALEHERAQPVPDVTVDASNAASAAWGELRFEEVRDLALESATGSTQQVTNPYDTLVAWHLARGETEHAIAAVWDMKRWTQAQAPPMRALSRAPSEAVLARVLLVAGEHVKGMELIDRAIAHPGRGGLSSASAGRVRAGRTLLRLELRALARAREAERASARPLLARLWHALVAWLPDPAELRDRAVLRSEARDERVLVSTLRPYVEGGLSLAAPWSVGALIELLGPGVVDAARRRAMALERLPALAAYDDALAAELALARGEPAEALTRARAALEALPPFEALLRARVAAVAGEAARRAGDGAEALARFEQALQIDPGVLRRLDLALPARVRAPDSPLGRALAEALLRSPRLTPAREGFEVSVALGEAARLCLLSPRGDRLSCAEAELPEGPLEAQVEALSEAFHARAFSMPLGLSRVDLNSLDGMTTVAHEARREAVERLLGGL